MTLSSPCDVHKRWGMSQLISNFKINSITGLLQQADHISSNKSLVKAIPTSQFPQTENRSTTTTH